MLLAQCLEKSVARQQALSTFYPVSNIVPARLVFNYKKIPYKTVWLEHKDIETTLKSMYIQPNHRPHPHHLPN